MKKHEMATLIVETLGAYLSGTGFQFKKAVEGFVRPIHSGRQVLGVPLWDYDPEYEFSLNVCIRLDAVEAIFHRFSGAPRKYHALSFTTMSRLELFSGRLSHIRVTTAQQVASAGLAIASVVREKIVPFFSAHETVEALDRAVNCQCPGIDITQNPSGAMHSVILAHLAGGQHFKQLVDKHRTEMELRSTKAHPFNDLVEYLMRL
jgi:hypothetical protein